MATKNRGLAWSVAETQLLIGLWSENKILNVTDGTTNNAKVYEKFAKKLEKRGFHRTTAQIRDRMKRLKRDYKEVVDSNKTGSGKKTCHFFNELDRILGNNAFTNAVIDHDSVPMNVCQAELGKCVSSDEEEEVNNFYTHLRDRKRLKRGLRMLDVDTVSVENGEESGEKSKLEVEKMLLEMEKLRQEIGLIREEREKLALEKEVSVF
ncbi:hypothetical protein J437_LFUL017702 [Ladona fulva]|uniref:Myb/SANT-like DNA-binding domain-containing protein n=1 Tax=Ladona fulva TaxID=123851 RepID=A0A8K0KPQ7_LADFU|nr:hypothetical protein J437_LFUL017702 [Ladona fulva]